MSRDAASRLLRRVYRLLAWPITLLCLLYLGLTLARQWDQVRGGAAEWFWLPGLGIATVLITATALLVAAAWAGWLQVAGHRLPWRVALCTLLLSQVGKYLPGNVGHLIGRVGLTVRAGVAAASVALAIALETLALAVSTGLLALAALRPSDLQRVGLDQTTGFPHALGVLTAGLAIVGLGWRRWSSRLRLASDSLLPALMAIALYGLCWLLHAVAAYSLAPVLLEPFLASPLRLIGILAGAWLLGFVAPGAPGGLGVREAVLVLLLAPDLGEAAAASLALLLRLASIAADLLAFAIGLMLRPAAISQR